MTTSDPISLTQAQRLVRQCGHDPPARHPSGRPRDADRRLPAARRRRPRVPPRVGRGRRAARPLLVPRCRSAAAARGPRWPRPRSRPAPSTVPVYSPDLADRDARRRRPARRHPGVRPAPPRPADRGHAALHRRRRRGAGVRRGLGLRADGAAPGARPGRRPDGRLHRDRPRARLRSPDPYAVGHRVAPHRVARLRGRATGSPRPRSSRRSSGPRDRAPPSWPGSRARPTGDGAGRDRSIADRDEPRSRGVHPRGRGRQGRHRGRRGDPGRARPATVVRAAGGPRDRARRSTASGSTARSAGSTRARTCSSSGRPTFEVVGASPELLLQVEGDRLTTHPIAGTRPRGADAREDALLAEQLQRDPKERAEHVMLVDLGRNDLGRVARPGTVSGQQVHGGRALQPRPPPRVARRGAAQAGARRARCAPLGLPGGHAVGCARRSARCS